VYKFQDPNFSRSRNITSVLKVIHKLELNITYDVYTKFDDSSCSRDMIGAQKI